MGSLGPCLSEFVCIGRFIGRDMSFSCFFTDFCGHLEAVSENFNKNEKENNVPLEMNILGLLTGRNYPDSRFWEIAKAVGNCVIIGMDAHTPEQLSNPNYVEKAKLLCEGMEIIEELEIK